MARGPCAAWARASGGSERRGLLGVVAALLLDALATHWSPAFFGVVADVDQAALCFEDQGAVTECDVGEAALVKPDDHGGGRGLFVGARWRARR